jgi:hypothetical protein
MEHTFTIDMEKIIKNKFKEVFKKRTNEIIDEQVAIFKGKLTNTRNEILDEIMNNLYINQTVNKTDKGTEVELILPKEFIVKE